MIDPGEIQDFQLEPDPEDLGGFTGAVPLTRPIYGCEGLVVSVWTDDEDVEVTLSLAVQRAQEALRLVEPLLPELTRQIDAALRPLAAEGRVDRRRPGLLTLVLPAERLTEGLFWEFGLDADELGVHAIIEGREIVNVWAGD